MAAITSPNMSLTIPGAGTQPGPTYASNVNASLTLIDQHDHSPGRGVQITPAGLDINDTLDMQSNDLDNTNSIIFNAQASSAVLQALYVAPGTESPAINDLYFNDGSGNVIQITSAGTVNASIGSLPGESYSGGTFFWKQGTGSTTPANFDIGSIVLRPNVAATSLGVTLSPPSTIASAYSVALPELPISSSKIMSMNTGGDMFALIDVDNSSLQLVTNTLAVKALGIQTSMINTAAVTEPKMADDSVSTRTIVDGDVTKAKLADDVRLENEVFSVVVPSFTVRVATTVNGTMATAFDNGSSIDGVTIATNDLILIKNQTNAADNGVYVVQASGNPVRSTSYDTAAEINFAAVNVTAGTTNAGKKYFQNNFITTLGSDNQSWSTSSTQAWVVPTDVTVIDVLMAGAGGGGGGARSGNASGAAGGAGSVPMTGRLVVVPGETLSITIGAAGTAGTPGVGAGAGTNGGTGGTSSIKRGNTILFTTVGGTGGTLGAGSGTVTGVSSSLTITGFISGSGNGGTTATVGTVGADNFYAIGGAAGSFTTPGGGGGGGGGGAGLEAGGAGGLGVGAGPLGGDGGVGGIAAGGGGGGGASNTTGGSGGAGGHGYVSITYF